MKNLNSYPSWLHLALLFLPAFICLNMQVKAQDYTITTTGNAIVITDISGNSETLVVSENGSNIRFTAPIARTYSIDGAPAVAFSTPADVPLAGVTSITINTAAGNDGITIDTFVTTLPSLTINGGTGDDAVIFQGNINFVTNADLNVDLQNDDASPGMDNATINASAHLLLSGTGSAVIKVSQYVTFQSFSSLRTANGNLTIEANQQALSSSGNFYGLQVSNGCTIEATGTGIVTLKAKGGDGGTAQYGINLFLSCKISGGSNGTMEVSGTGGNSNGNLNNGIYAYGSDVLITSSGSNVHVTGQGGGVATFGTNYGINLVAGATITAGGNGNVDVSGTGVANSTSVSVGISISGGHINSAGGNVDVTGQGGGTGAATLCHGVEVINAGSISAGGNGIVTVNGTGGTGTGGANYGVSLYGANSMIISSGGNVNVTGWAGGSGTSSGNIGVVVASSASITAGGYGIVTLLGNGSSTTGSVNYGILITLSATVNSSGGSVKVTGIGGAGSSFLNVGISVEQGGVISAGDTGSVMISGTGGLASGSYNYGVQVNGSGSKIISSGGNVTVTGQGGGTAVSSENVGIFVIAGAIITAGGSGMVTLHGTGGASTGDSNIGVMVYNAVALVTSSGGNVNVTGVGGGSDASKLNYGVYVTGTGSINAGGNGTVTVNGTGGSSAGNSDYGVYVSGTNSTITSSGGNISVTGQGGNAGSSSIGVAVSGGLINAGGNGVVTVIGTGGASGSSNSNEGVALSSSGIISSSGGNVNVNGIGGGNATSFFGWGVDVASGGKITAGGAGTVTVQGTGNSGFQGYGINVRSSGSMITSSGGDINIAATRSIYTPLEADLIINSGGVIKAGTNGNITITTTSAGTWPNTAGTDISLSADKTLSFGNNSKINFDIDGITVDAQYQQLKINGLINLSNVALTFTGSTLTPSLGQTFTIINNDSTDAITGTFAGLPEGAVISNFLGSSLSASVTYVGGTGNDVVLTVVPTCINPGVPILAATVNPLCSGNTTTLSIQSGNLNNATNWQWYSSSCAGTPVGSGTSINVSPNTPTTYYARGEGGCVTLGSCGSITITVNTPQAWYLDADSDGHYFSGPVSACGSPGAGYNTTATQSGDCDDNDNTKWQSASLYIDVDGDGFDNGSATVCYGATIPSGYATTTLGSDCDDANSNVHSGVSEVCNGIDDDCDGNIDNIPSPVASFIVSCDLLYPGNTATFTSTSMPGSGTIVSYQWNLNAAPIIGATNSTYTTGVNANGDYSLTVTNSNNCSNISAVSTINNLSGPLSTGTYSIPSTCGFSSINSAITYLNANGLSGSVIFNVAAGYTETAPIGGIVWNQCGLAESLKSGATQTVTFQKSGAGNNPIVYGYTGTGTTDAIIKILGGDYLTFDGINVTDNSTSSTFQFSNEQMEYGYELLKCDGNNGSNYNTIENCIITLHIDYQNTIGIYSGTSGYTYSGTANDPAAIDASRNGHNSFYGITFQSAYQPISLNGTPGVSGSISLSDTLNMIGQVSGSGNTITDFGGLYNSASAINASYQHNISIDNNIISCFTSGSFYSGSETAVNISNSHSANVRNNSFSFNSAWDIYGIYCSFSAGTVSNPNIINITGNTVSGYSSNNCHTLKPIYCSAGGDSAVINLNNNTVPSIYAQGDGTHDILTLTTGNKASVTINGNNLHTCAQFGNGQFNLVQVSAGNQCKVTMNNNNINNNSTQSGSSALSCVSVVLGNYGSLSASRNTILTNTDGTGFPVTPWSTSVGAGTHVNLQGNTLQDNYTYTSAGFGFTMTALSVTGSADSVTVSKNIIDGNYSLAGGTFNGMVINTPSAYVVCDSNSITNSWLYEFNYLGTTTMNCASINASSYVFSNNLIDKNAISGSQNAAYVYGFQSSGAFTNETVVNNTISNMTTGATSSYDSYMYGLNLSSSTAGNRVVSGNKIFHLLGMNFKITGILSGGPGTATVYNNKIDSIESNGNYHDAVVGMENASGASSVYYNNYVGDLIHRAEPASDTSQNSATGFLVSGGTSVGFYNNTIQLPAGSGQKFNSSGVNVVGTTALDMRNNIIVNLCNPGSTSGNAVAYRRSSIGFSGYASTSDHNVFYAGAPSVSHLIYYDGTNASQTLADYKYLVALADQNSKTENVTFASTDPMSANFLHVNTTVPTYCESGGATVSEITTDYDGDVRQGNSGYSGTGTTPDIGADEFEGVQGDITAPEITYTSLGNLFCFNDSTITVTITDVSGINTTAGHKPRFYFRKSTDVNTFSGNTSADNGWKYVEASNTSSLFTFTTNFSLLQSAPLPGDVIQYFVVAEDLAGTPNVAMNSGTFTRIPFGVALPASAFPITGNINSYNVVATPVYYIDNDHDGYGDGNDPGTAYCNPPSDVVSDHTDCNDNDATVHAPQSYYVDTDEDGSGSTTTALVCSSTPLTGYSNDNTDCNDNDASVSTPQLYYLDEDQDGYGSTITAMLCSSTALIGYSTSSTDCNDNDSTVHTPQLYYVDADKDGYGSTNTAMLCSSTAPTGYSVGNTDCDDDNSASHPGATELCNNVDDNCDGQMDEIILNAGIVAAGATDLCPGENVVLNASPTSGTYQYQWYNSGGAISGGTNSSYTAAASNDYYIIISSASCTGTSNTISVILKSPTPVSVSPDGTINACAHYSVTLSANPASEMNYQWYRNNHIVSGATSDTYNTGGVQAGQFKVVATNTNGCTSTSNAVTINRFSTPEATINIQNPPNNPDLCINGQVKMAAKAAVTSGLAYQWYLNNVAISGATSRIYTAGNAGTYKVKVTDTGRGCSRTSSEVKVIQSCKAAILNPTADMNLYPNPTSGHFVVELNLDNTEDTYALVQVFNAIGQLVNEDNISMMSGKLMKEIRLDENQTAGLYLVKVIVNGKVYNGQVICQR